ncbi:hypothetical protein [Vibrio phage PhiImVa-1]|nr:hypothetical protein [Vibrio phage PhiImVa-1]UOX40324.1 hypothetical protein [Vibrio phage PhiImVa-1]
MKLIKTYPLKYINGLGNVVNTRMVFNPKTQESIWFETGTC